MTESTHDLKSIQAESLNLTEHNIEQLKQLFPNVFSEGKIDFDALKSELGEVVETESERYQFTWAGKEQAKRIASTPSLGTLRPAPEESVNWDSTENLYIEGDNLEVLKLLQKSYGPKPGSNGGKVKMIYIDPPYNTGKDFVYKDDFKDNLANYQRLTGQKDDEGNPLTTNSESAGRYHSNWLNMMYPRLKLARNLLKDDGVIFISIDDNEVHNLRKVCDEIFGEGNYIGMISRSTGTRMGSGSRGIARELDYLLVYSKTQNFQLSRLPMTGEESSIYNEEDSKGRYLLRSLRRTGGENRREDRPSMFFPVTAPDGTEVLPLAPEGWESRWVCGRETYEALVKSGDIQWKQVNKNGEMKWQVYQKTYMADGRESSDLWVKDAGNKKATKEVNALFNGVKVFDHPKPTDVIKKIIQLGSEEDSIILDFFAGSSTTGHATYLQNIDDRKNRKFILVQVPEILAKESQGFKNGYSTIAEIGKERIRRAAKKIKEEHPDTQADLGFKVLKLDTSNIKKWNPNLDTLETDLLDAVDNILPDRTAEDLLYEVLIKYGLPLTLPIKKIDINSNGQTYQAWSVAHNSLVACFDENITLETVQAIANLSTPENPVLRVVFRDTSFTDDITKTNAIQRLKQTGIEDVLSI